MAKEDTAAGAGPLAAIAPDWPELGRYLDSLLDMDEAERLQRVQSDASLTEPRRAMLLQWLQRARLSTGDLLRPLSQLGDAAAGLAGIDDPPGGALTPSAGVSVGPYRLVRELGQGGMGSVWLAERRDGPVKRPLALKLPRLAWGGALAERLARERDILGALDHPHIARLLDAGVDNAGRPWLALEYVDGLPLDAHARQAALPLRERVRLLLQVASAVAYAHARLVVHRDLKPSNILVTAAGEVRLLDFGIAKLLDGDRAESTALTRAAGRALTPDYASPEQIRGDPLGVASDVYSLGVVAYELLAGARPHRRERASDAALEDAVLTLDAAPASRAAADAGNAEAARGLRGDLDAILNRALKKSVDERYATVEALAEDWRRWLNDEPVSAQPDRAGYRLRKFVRRHRARVATAAGVAVLLVGGAGVSLWQARQAEAARALAEEEAANARAVQGFLESVFLVNSGDQARPGSGRETTARELLDRGAERIASELLDQPLARLRLLEVLGGIYEDLSEFDRLRELAELRVAQARAMPSPRRERELTAALADLAHALAIGGREADARARLDEAEALWPGASPGDPRLRLRLLVRRAAVHRADDPQRAAAAAEQALALAATLPPSADGTNAAYLVAEARVLQGQAEQALPVIHDAVALLQRQPELGASILAPLLTLQGDAEFGLGRFDAAEASYRRGIEVERARGGSGVLPHYLTVQLAQFFVRQERWSEAAAVIAPTAAWARTPAGAFDTTVPMATVTQGQALLGLGRVTEAQAVLDLAVQQVSQLQDAADVAPRIEAVRAKAWVASGRLADAERALAAIDAARGGSGQPPAPQIEQTRRELLLARGQPAQALAAWRAERAAAQRPEQPDPRDEPVAAVAWARLLHAAGEPAAALAQAQAAIAAFDARQSAGAPWRGVTWARAWQVADEALLDLGRKDEAADARRRAAVLLAAQPAADQRR